MDIYVTSIAILTSHYEVVSTYFIETIRVMRREYRLRSIIRRGHVAGEADHSLGGLKRVLCEVRYRCDKFEI